MLGPIRPFDFLVEASNPAFKKVINGDSVVLGYRWPHGYGSRPATTTAQNGLVLSQICGIEFQEDCEGIARDATLTG
ncbi:uncharacterized protein J7T54_001168 [Emericellopsis cladophorae]|uniref:Uncharacterized protein n=1 Tax=Emericellopsis cladophorae TaxID=2686198 RepID=A0A9Q0BDX9_9HYPO|nr:uncharacterized protein J7T54_001168 [Emericellopsis cladophorae]KAI6780664.1 hypothetical protein J7T54_001168 [Emericellopsis cladophorae]